jgi:hypothetical protein
MPQQTTTSIFGQGYTHTAPSFSMLNLGSAPYNFGYNGQTYPNPDGNYQVPYTTIAYIDPIPLPGNSLGFLPNHAYQNVSCFNAYGQSEAAGFGYETPSQFPSKPQPINMTPARATVEPSTDPNNLTNQLATILRESFSIEPKG